MTKAINVSPPSRRRFDINLASNWKVPVSSLGSETIYLDKWLWLYTELPQKYREDIFLLRGIEQWFFGHPSHSESLQQISYFQRYSVASDSRGNPALKQWTLSYIDCLSLSVLWLCDLGRRENRDSCYTLNKTWIFPPYAGNHSMSFRSCEYGMHKLILAFQNYATNVVRRCIIEADLFLNLRANFRLEELLPVPSRLFHAPLLSCLLFPKFIKCANTTASWAVRAEAVASQHLLLLS
jgi:hypothetical protein